MVLRYILSGEALARSPDRRHRNYEPVRPRDCRRAFFSGDRVELRALDGTPPPDPENGDAEYYRHRATSAVAADSPARAPLAEGLHGRRNLTQHKPAGSGFHSGP